MASSSKPQTLKKQSFSVPTVKPGDPSVGASMPENPSTSVLPGFLTPPMEDSSLSKSSHLSRQEILRRRLNHVKQLSRVYRDHYWALMEELKVMYRDYYWKYGVSPYKEDEERDTVGSVDGEGCVETNTNNNCSFGGRNNNGGGCGGKLGLGFEESGGVGLELKYGGNNPCAFVGCELKAMALTAFCHLHILSDPQQKLYKPCNHLIKSAQAGPINCGKAIMRSTLPTLCNAHYEKIQKEMFRALRKGGLTSSSIKLAPKFHVIVAEYVPVKSNPKDEHLKGPVATTLSPKKRTCLEFASLLFWYIEVNMIKLITNGWVKSIEGLLTTLKSVDVTLGFFIHY